MGNKCSKSKKNTTDNDPQNFIIQHNRDLDNNINNNISLVDSKRLVFISLIGLFETWKNCPTLILYSSIFVLPIKREWICSPLQSSDDIKEDMNSNWQCDMLQPDSEKNKMFIDLLKWKDSQGLLFCMLDDYDIESTKNKVNPLINPFWYNFSSKLTALYDSVNKCKYKPVQFVENWWRNTYNKDTSYLSKYKTKVSTIFIELYFLQMKYQSIKEIIHQSNPNSFNIQIRYNKHNTVSKCVSTVMIEVNVISIRNMFNSDDDYSISVNGTGIRNQEQPGNSGKWFISKEYDPYDI